MKAEEAARVIRDGKRGSSLHIVLSKYKHVIYVMEGVARVIRQRNEGLNHLCQNWCMYEFLRVFYCYTDFFILRTSTDVHVQI